MSETFFAKERRQAALVCRARGMCGRIKAGGIGDGNAHNGRVCEATGFWVGVGQKVKLLERVDNMISEIDW